MEKKEKKSSLVKETILKQKRLLSPMLIRKKKIFSLFFILFSIYFLFFCKYSSKKQRFDSGLDLVRFIICQHTYQEKKKKILSGYVNAMW